MIELEILYVDETRRRVPAERAGTLVSTNVLFLFIHSDVQSYRIYGEDFYAFGYKAPSLWWLFGWDEYDEFLRAYDEINPNPGAWTPLPMSPVFPAGWVVTLFNGGSVSVADWDRILPTTEGINLSRNP